MVQRAAALVGTGIRIRAVLEQPSDGLWPFVLGGVHECFVKDVLGNVARRQTVQPPDVGRVWSVQVRLGDQSAVPIEEQLEPRDASSARRDPRRVGYEFDRGENISRRAGGVIDRGLKRCHAMDSPRVHPGARGKQNLDKFESVEARGEVERTIQVAAAFDQQIDAGAVDAERMAQRAPERVRFRYVAEERAAGADLDAQQLGV